MATNYTTLLGFALPTTGELSGTWGNVVNTSITELVEDAIAGTVTADVTSGDWTLTTSGSGAVNEARSAILIPTGTPGVSRNIIAPGSSKAYIVDNQSNAAVVVKASATTGCTINAGRSALVAWDGSDFVLISDDLSAPPPIGNVTPNTGAFTTVTATTGNITTVNATTTNATTTNATTVDTTNLEVTNLKAKDGTAAGSIANSTGVVTIASSVLTTTDINGGTIDGVTVGGASAGAGTFTNLTANTDLTINSTTTVDGIIDDDTMATASATKLATSESVKAYVDSQVSTVDTWAEVLANGNTSGGTNVVVSSGDVLTTNTINETTAGSGVTVDSVLLKDDSVNATSVEVTNIKANDGTAAATVANSTGVVTIASSVLTTTDINGGTIDGTNITVGAGKTLNVSAGTFTVANDQISGDAINGGTATPTTLTTTTVNATTGNITTVGATTGNITTVNATTVDTTNIEVTNLKAKDGTAAGSIADSTGVVTLNSVVLTTADINAGDVDATTLQEGGVAAVVQSDIGTDPNQVPLNQYLGSMAYQDADNVIVGNLTVTGQLNFLQELLVGSFEYDFATSTPDSIFGRRQVVTGVHDKIRGCVLNADGSVNYYLSADNWALKADGTASDLTGADGNVMVEIPKFYYRVEQNVFRRTWKISAVQQSGFVVHPAFIKDGVEVDYRYYGAYDACVYDDSASGYLAGLNLDDNTSNVDLVNDSLASVKGVYPMVGLTRDEFRTLAENVGSGWRQLDFALWSAVQVLYLVEYQSFYSQDILGAGNTNGSYVSSSSNQSDSPHTIAGAGDSIANGSTDTTSGAGVSAKPGTSFMKYRGIENFYGNCWNWADGINVNIGTAGTVYVTNNATNWADNTSTNYDLITSSLSTGSNYISDLLPADPYFLASAVSGSSSTYITDRHYGSASTNRAVLVGGGAWNGSTAGAFCLDSSSASSVAYRLFGGRLAF